MCFLTANIFAQAKELVKETVASFASAFRTPAFAPVVA